MPLPALEQISTSLPPNNSLSNSTNEEIELTDKDFNMVDDYEPQTETNPYENIEEYNEEEWLDDDSFAQEEEVQEESFYETSLSEPVSSLKEDEALAPFVHPETIKPKKKNFPKINIKKINFSFLRIPKIFKNKTVITTLFFSFIFLVFLILIFNFLNKKLAEKKSQSAKKEVVAEKQKEIEKNVKDQTSEKDEKEVEILKVYEKSDSLFADVKTKENVTAEIQVLYKNKKDGKLVLCYSEQSDFSKEDKKKTVELFCSYDDIKLKDYTIVTEQFYLIE